MTPKRIIVPLSARDDAEAVLSVVAVLARESGAVVRCLRVWPIPEPRTAKSGRVVATVDQEMERLSAQALDEFRHVEEWLRAVPAERVVRFGSAAHEILLEAEAWGADLIAVTQRATWLGRLLEGRTARTVAHEATVPVLLCRPYSEQTFRLRWATARASQA